MFRGADALAVAAAAGCALVAIRTDGLPQRYPQAIRTILAEAADHEPRLHECVGLTAEDVRKGRLCQIGAKMREASFLLWGDSHADALIPAVQSVAGPNGRVGLFAGTIRLPALRGVNSVDAEKMAA